MQYKWINYVKEGTKRISITTNEKHRIIAIPCLHSNGYYIHSYTLLKTQHSIIEVIL